MGKRLYVGNMSYDSNEDGLRALFSEDGRNVTDVHIVLDRDTGRPRGFAFVEMATDEEAQAAIDACDGANLDGRPLRVNEAQEHTAQERLQRSHSRLPSSVGFGSRVDVKTSYRDFASTTPSIGVLSVPNSWRRRMSTGAW